MNTKILAPVFFGK